MTRPPLRAHEIASRETVRVDDLAAILDVSPNYIRKCIRCGTLPALKVGNKHRIRADDALSFLSSLGIDATVATSATA